MVCKHHSKYENERIKERKEDRVMLKKERWKRKEKKDKKVTIFQSIINL